MKVQAGKYYRTGNGAKVGPLLDTNNDIWPWCVKDSKYPNGCIYWGADGTPACYGVRSDRAYGYELVVEWDEKNDPLAVLNSKIDRVTFEASAQIERLKARVAALEGKMK